MNECAERNLFSVANESRVFAVGLAHVRYFDTLHEIKASNTQFSLCVPF